MTENIVTINEFNYLAGRKAFRDGRKMKPLNSTRRWNKATPKERALWLGWMVERGLGIIKEIRIRDWAENGDNLP